MLGIGWHHHLMRRPGPAWRCMAVATVFPVVFLGLTILEHHTGCFQRGGGFTWSPIDARTDPTADLYGWDEVVARLDQLGILDDPNRFLFTRVWYQSAQLAHAIRLKLPVLCYNIDDPRGFAFWSKPETWVGRDAIFLLINEDFIPVSFYERWFDEVMPIADFTIDRGGKPLRRVQAFRMVHQRVAFPFDFSAERIAARERLRAGGHPLDIPPRTANAGHQKSTSAGSSTWRK
jgi:hypothetical protein